MIRLLLKLLKIFCYQYLNINLCFPFDRTYIMMCPLSKKVIIIFWIIKKWKRVQIPNDHLDYIHFFNFSINKIFTSSLLTNGACCAPEIICLGCQGSVGVCQKCSGGFFIKDINACDAYLPKFATCINARKCTSCKHKSFFYKKD